MQIEHRKSAVDLTDLALGIVILGVAVGIGATILVNLRNTQVTNAATYSVNLEDVTVANIRVGAKLSTVWGKSVDYCQNGTTSVIPGIGTGGNYSYSINSDNGLITINNLTSNYRDTDWKCNYTVYNTSDPRYSLPNSAAIGLGEYGNWFKIIVIVGVASLILGIIFLAFGGRSISSGGGGIGGTY